MTGMRKAGLWILGVAAALWLVLTIAVAMTPADEGANIGAGMLFMLAVPCTVTGVVLIAAGRSRPAPQQWAAPAGSPYPGGTLLAAPVAPPVFAPAYGNAPSGWGLALGIAGFLLSWMAPIGISEAAYFLGVAVSVAISLAGAALGFVGLRHVRSGRATSRGLALAAAIVGLTSAGLNSLLVVEGVVLFLL
jgi:hypothetical protein